MTRHAPTGHRPILTHDLEAVVLAAEILAVLLAICLVSAIWPHVL
jgi:hypothetical protein